MLEQLTDAAREQVARQRQQVPLALLEAQLGERSPLRPFSEALTRPGLSVIAEFKRRSPSVGEIRPGADLAEMVRAYEAGGAAALSVLTEETHFGGSMSDLMVAREAGDLPILRKDFIVDPYQVYESAAGGADAILLVAAALDDDDLAELHACATELDLDCVIEVHDENDLIRALELDADVIGINNRDLDDFSVDLRRTFELMPDVPAGKTVVSESGISTRETLDMLDRIGVDAVLIGEALMRAPDPQALVFKLTAGEEATGEHPL